MRRSIVVALVASALAVPVTAQQGAPKKRRPLPHEYGRVVIDNHSSKAGIAPVVFDHWFHRARYTCRLCHVDVGFAMKTGATDIRAADNAKGYYCGACHNGRTASPDGKIFESCGKAIVSREPRLPCMRCHVQPKDVRPEHDLAAFTQGFPRGRFGNGVDWEKAEEEHRITPVDSLEGISIPRRTLAVQKDFSLSPKIQGMPDIIFSHQKHTVWNGCELCHPEIFVGVKRGATKFTMNEVFEGKYCGVCHATVAFPLLDCQRCHSKPVQ